MKNVPIEQVNVIPKKGGLYPRGPDGKAIAKPGGFKKDSVSDEVYNNNGMRQTSMIPFITIKDGVKLTELQNGKEVIKAFDP